MHYVLMGLGNPGAKYARTRHNVGFMFLDWLKSQAEAQSGDTYEWKNDKYSDARLLKLPVSAFLNNKSEQALPDQSSNDYRQKSTVHSPPSIVLVKPQTFMNRSGFTANKLLAHSLLHRPPTTDHRPSTNVHCPSSTDHRPPTLIVVHDDLDIRLGEFKISFGKGPKLHNGISSIESSLRFKDFWRVRIGVDNRTERLVSGEEYVLQRFLSEEEQTLQGLFPRIVEGLTACRDQRV